MKPALWLAVVCVLASPTALAQSAPDAPPETSTLTPPPVPPPEPERVPPPNSERAPAPPTALPEAPMRRGAAPGVRGTPSAMQANQRLSLELLVGGVGELTGGVLGYLVGSTLGGSDPQSRLALGFGGALFGLMACTGGGVLLVGTLDNAEGSGAGAFLGVLAGTVLGVGLSYLGLYTSAILVIVGALCPVVGATIGYELSTPKGPGPAPASAPRMMPTVTPAPSGDGAVLGVFGIF